MIRNVFRFDRKHKKKEIQSKQNKWCNMLSTSSTNSATSKSPKEGTASGTAGGKKSSTGGENSSPTTPKMAKGVGYSTYNHKGWDIDSYLAAQQVMICFLICESQGWQSESVILVRILIKKPKSRIRNFNCKFFLQVKEFLKNIDFWPF